MKKKKTKVKIKKVARRTYLCDVCIREVIFPVYAVTGISSSGRGSFSCGKADIKPYIEIGIDDDALDVSSTVVHEIAEIFMTIVGVAYTHPMSYTGNDPDKRLFVIDHKVFSEMCFEIAEGTGRIRDPLRKIWKKRKKELQKNGRN